MLGAIIGDIVGSTYEFHNIKTKEFPFFPEYSNYTDDSILTLATADWLLHGGDVAHLYSNYAAKNDASYGGMFILWVARSQTKGDFHPLQQLWQWQCNACQPRRMGVRHKRGGVASRQTVGGMHP